MNITYKSPGALEQTRFEKIHSVIFNDSKQASKIVAQEIADLIKNKQKQNKNCVLGLTSILRWIKMILIVIIIL